MSQESPEHVVMALHLSDQPPSYPPQDTGEWKEEHETTYRICDTLCPLHRVIPDCCHCVFYDDDFSDGNIVEGTKTNECTIM